jgi:hypothetical protein
MTDVLKEYLVKNDHTKSKKISKSLFIPRYHLIAVIAFGLTLKFMTKFQSKIPFLMKHFNKIKAVIIFMFGASILSVAYKLYKSLTSASII